MNEPWKSIKETDEAGAGTLIRNNLTFLREAVENWKIKAEEEQLRHS